MAAPTVAKVTSVFRQKLFKDKVALVTGGATGIGKTITQELLYLGCNVMIASRKADNLKAAVTEIQGNLPGCDVRWTECNIRKEDSVKKMVSTTLEQFGKIDFLVNNGGGQFYAPTSEFSLKGFNAVVETNLTGTFLCMKEELNQSCLLSFMQT
ncbi:PECR [Bugula neritina]|uniref:Peroxisomal trans-2-enoyl-CoA reductase n=1 Tax=Bugula neritina TaxID=10212 RepID=A0A7J7JQ91_BUGNE|nr:PECR [Bugula neritina]